MEPIIFIAGTVLAVTLVTAVDAARFPRRDYVAAGQLPEFRMVFILGPLLSVVTSLLMLFVVLYYWIGVRPKLARTRRARTDLALPDDVWLRVGEQHYHQLRGHHQGSPETLATAGEELLRSGGHAPALFFFQEAIGQLQAHYVVNHMVARQPGIEDSRIFLGYLTALENVLLHRPYAPVGASAWIVTQHVEAITIACHNADHDTSLYLCARDRLARLSRLSPLARASS